MSQGPSAALDRFNAILASRLSGWSKNIQPIADGGDASPVGSDKTYLVKIKTRERMSSVVSNVTQTKIGLEVQLIRDMTGMDAYGFDDESMRQSLEASAFPVEECLCNPKNYDFSNTGVILVTPESPASVSDVSIENSRMIWRAGFSAIIRQASASVTI